MKSQSDLDAERRENLLDAWYDHTESLATEDRYFEEVFHGYVTVYEDAKKRTIFELEDGRKIKNIPLPDEVRKYSEPEDLLFMALGRSRGKWWPIEVISIAVPVYWEEDEEFIVDAAHSNAYVNDDELKPVVH